MSAPSQFRTEQKHPKIVYIIPNFIVLYFGEHFMKIQTKIPKIQMHENLHKNVNENMMGRKAAKQTNKHRVATVREKMLENEKCSRSGKSQGISFSVMEKSGNFKKFEKDC